MDEFVDIELKPIYEKLGNDVGCGLHIGLSDGDYFISDIDNERYNIAYNILPVKVMEVNEQFVKVLTEYDDILIFTKEAFKLGCSSYNVD